MSFALKNKVLGKTEAVWVQQDGNSSKKRLRVTKKQVKKQNLFFIKKKGCVQQVENCSKKGFRLKRKQVKEQNLIFA